MTRRRASSVCPWSGSECTQTQKHTNTQTHKHTNTTTHKHTNTPTHKHTNTHPQTVSCKKKILKIVTWFWHQSKKRYTEDRKVFLLDRKVFLLESCHAWESCYVRTNESFHTYKWMMSHRWICDAMTHVQVQPIAFEVSFSLNVQSQFDWSLFNGTWQKRPRKLDYRFRFENEEMTLQMQ